VVSDVASRTSPRQRILDTARDLFHERGIRAVGVDAIAEAAGTNKMTMYRHFSSKDDLIVACLRSFASDADRVWSEIESGNPGDKMAQLRTWVLMAAQCVASDERGCNFANAAVELTESNHPARIVIEEFKALERDRLATLCRDADIAEAELLADTLSLLLEGARVSRQSVGPKGPCAGFIRSAEAIIDSFAKARRPAVD
jgi:AcrR family transcriptional regulator